MKPVLLWVSSMACLVNMRREFIVVTYSLLSGGPLVHLPFLISHLISGTAITLGGSEMMMLFSLIFLLRSASSCCSRFCRIGLFQASPCMLGNSNISTTYKTKPQTLSCWMSHVFAPVWCMMFQVSLAVLLILPTIQVLSKWKHFNSNINNSKQKKNVRTNIIWLLQCYEGILVQLRGPESPNSVWCPPVDSCHSMIKQEYNSTVKLYSGISTKHIHAPRALHLMQSHVNMAMLVHSLNKNWLVAWEGAD